MGGFGPPEFPRLLVQARYKIPQTQVSQVSSQYIITQNTQINKILLVVTSLGRYLSYSSWLLHYFALFLFCLFSIVLFNIKPFILFIIYVYIAITCIVTSGKFCPTRPQHLHHVQQSSSFHHLSSKCQIHMILVSKKRRNRQENEPLSLEARAAICASVPASQKKKRQTSHTASILIVKLSTTIK